MAGYIASKGSKIFCNSTALAQVTKIKPPKLHAGSAETTHLLSNWEEFLATIAGAEELTCTVEPFTDQIGGLIPNTTSNTSFGFINRMSTGTLDTWEVQLGSGTAAITGTAFITGIDINEQNVQGVVSYDLTIKPTSAWALTT